MELNIELEDLQFVLAKNAYIGYKRFMRLLMGKRRRDDYMNRHGIGLNSFIKTKRPIKANGIIAIPRPNTDDYAMLFMPREEEQILNDHLQINENETFVDIGANVGYYTLRAATTYRGDNIRIVSIEADPENYKALCCNIAHNGFDNVIAINKAISSMKGTVTLYRRINASKRRVATSESSTSFDFGKESSLSIESDTLDNIVKEYNIHPNVIKMDIEGAEVDALKGSTDTLRHSRKIIVEIHGTNLEKVKAALQNHDFNIQVVNLSGQDYVIGDKISKSS